MTQYREPCPMCGGSGVIEDVDDSGDLPCLFCHRRGYVFCCPDDEAINPPTSQRQLTGEEHSEGIFGTDPLRRHPHDD